MIDLFLISYGLTIGFKIKTNFFSIKCFLPHKELSSFIRFCTPVCRLCGRYLAILGRPIRIIVPAVTVVPTALVGSLIRSSNLPHSLQRGVHQVSLVGIQNRQIFEWLWPRL